MNAEEYLKSSKKVTVKVKGYKDFTGKSIVRPTLGELLKVCDTREDGTITFTDEVEFKHPLREVVVDSLELWYGRKRVAMRSLPPIHMGANDSLKITWSLSMTRTGPVWNISV